jgi:hypothetical protein
LTVHDTNGCLINIDKTKNYEEKPKIKRIYPTEEDPKYGKRFIITGMQFQDIDGNYSELGKFRVEVEPGKPQILEVGKNHSEFIRLKHKLSDTYVSLLNGIKHEGYLRMKKETMFPSFLPDEQVNYKDLVALQVEYLDFPGQTFIL